MTITPIRRTGTFKQLVTDTLRTRTLYQSYGHIMLFYLYCIYRKHSYVSINLICLILSQLHEVMFLYEIFTTVEIELETKTETELKLD